MGNSKSIYSKPQYLYYYIQKNDIPNINKILQTTPTLLNEPLSKDNKHTALMRAAYNNNTIITQLLLLLKPDVNIITPKGQTALSIAVKRNHIKIVEILIVSGANIGFVSKAGLRVIEYAILAGFYDITRIIFKELTNQQKQAIQDPQTYAELGKKYSYRYGLFQNKTSQQLPNFLKKEKKKLLDPVVDPRQTWKQWVKRQLQWKDAPLIERNQLPQNLQPQNRVLGKVHHYTNNFISTHMSQKTILYPKSNQIASELGELNTKKSVNEKGFNQQKPDFEVQSEI